MKRYDFVDRSSIAGAAIDQLSGTSYWIDEQTIGRAFGRMLEPAAADLISIALSCYAADRLARRSRLWKRDLHLKISVSDPTYWSERATDLAAFLRLSTDDEWHFDFAAGRRIRLSEQQASLFQTDLAPDTVVGLFSGGLDSLAGATRLLAAGRKLVLLSARSSVVVGRDQSMIARDLRIGWPDQLIHLQIPLHLRDVLVRESTQRARSFLYLSLATVAAATAGLRTIAVFENGIGAYNPRLGEHQWGSQSNLSTHPHVLASFETLMAVVGFDVKVVLPHRFETKADHVSRMPSPGANLIGATASCDSYPLRRANITHCGRCASCVLRRQSLVASGLGALDRSDYQSWPFERGAYAGETHRLSARQAWQFDKLMHIDNWLEISRLWPSLGLGVTSDTERADILSLFRRYADEWNHIIDRRSWLRHDYGWPEREAA